jgi:hypothetical protein
MPHQGAECSRLASSTQRHKRVHMQFSNFVHAVSGMLQTLLTSVKQVDSGITINFKLLTKNSADPRGRAD